MPRANRHHLPDHVCHITHQCHKQEYLLKPARGRQRPPVVAVLAAHPPRRRYGLYVMNYIVTSNHVHRLVRL